MSNLRELEEQRDYYMNGSDEYRPYRPSDERSRNKILAGIGSVYSKPETHYTYERKPDKSIKPPTFTQENNIPKKKKKKALSSRIKDWLDKKLTNGLDD